MVAPTNVRFPADLDGELTRYATTHSLGKSSVVVRALREWLDMQSHPGIVFDSDTDGVSRPRLARGPHVWTVAEAWLQHPPSARSAKAVAEATGLTEDEVEIALNYWAVHRSEIDNEVQRRHAEQDAALAQWERRRALDQLA